MSTKTIRLTMEIRLDDLDAATRREMAEMIECDEFPSVEDIETEGFVSAFKAALLDQAAMQEALWAGSEMYAKIGAVSISKAEVVS
jgi:hypothetical protein